VKRIKNVVYLPGTLLSTIVIGQLNLFELPVKSRMSRRCPIYVPYMSHIFKDTRHLWGMYGASAVQPPFKG
jgi:hypothetical protein